MARKSVTLPKRIRSMRLPTAPENMEAKHTLSKILIFRCLKYVKIMTKRMSEKMICKVVGSGMEKARPGFLCSSIKKIPEKISRGSFSFIVTRYFERRSKRRISKPIKRGRNTFILCLVSCTNKFRDMLYSFCLTKFFHFLGNK